MITAAQQNAAAERQLRERGVGQERINGLAFRAREHVRWQRQIAKSNPLAVYIDAQRARARRTVNTDQ